MNYVTRDHDAAMSTVVLADDAGANVDEPSPQRDCRRTC
jgi:predicted alpha/beta-hydrolase family hydrolase